MQHELDRGKRAPAKGSRKGGDTGRGLFFFVEAMTCRSFAESETVWMRNLSHKLSVARGEQPAELLFKNARLINVLSGEAHPAHIAIDDGRVIGFGDYEARKVVDLEGRCLAPSFIDGHFHVESTLLTVPEVVRAVVPHGTGVMVIDPHEYANVLGLDGIRYVLSSSRNL